MFASKKSYPKYAVKSFRKLIDCTSVRVYHLCCRFLACSILTSWARVQMYAFSYFNNKKKLFRFGRMRHQFIDLICSSAHAHAHIHEHLHKSYNNKKKSPIYTRNTWIYSKLADSSTTLGPLSVYAIHVVYLKLDLYERAKAKEVGRENWIIFASLILILIFSSLRRSKQVFGDNH